MVPPSFCSATRLGGFICRINFDILPDSSVPTPFGDVIRAQYQADTGVSFPGGGWVVRPSKGTNSADFALINASSGGELEFNSSPLRIEFTNVQVTSVKMHIGLNQVVSGVRPVLTVFDATGTLTASTTGPVLPDGPAPVDQVIAVSAPGFFITRAELRYDGDTPAARNAVEVIDDLEIGIDGRPLCPPATDTQSPAVTITMPKDFDLFSSSNLPELRGSIIENSGKLLNVSAEIAGPGGSYAFDLSPYLESNPEFPGYFVFSVKNVGLYAGENDIIVRAADAACPPNEGGGSIRADFVPPPPDLNFYVLAVEVTQATQDALQVRTVTFEGNDPSAFRPLAYGGAMPLVADKRTAVRVYPGITGSTSLVNSVPAVLNVRRGDTETRLVADPIPVDPTDTVMTSGGLLDVAQTLERKRADAGKGWQFTLPFPFTSAGQIDQLEVRINPTDLFGPQECLGCNDAANRLAVENIPLRATGQLAVKVVLARDTFTGLRTDPDAGSQTLCDSFHRTFPVRDGCGTSPSGGIILSNVAQVYNSRSWVLGKTDTASLFRDLACKAGSRGWSDNVYRENLTLANPAHLGTGNGLGGSGCAASPQSDWPTTAQEVAHSWMLWHAPCPPETTPYPPPTPTPQAPPNVVPDFPNADGTIGQEGYHTVRSKVLPRTAWDWMSYCSNYSDPPDFNNWVSPFTYRHLFGYFDRGSAGLITRVTLPAATTAQVEYLLASGSIQNAQSASLDPFYRVLLPAGTDDAPGSGPYSLELQDQTGQPLFIRHFEAEFLPAAPGLETFHETLPYATGTARVVLKLDQLVIAERAVTANSPTVTLLSPVGGEVWGATEAHVISWSASDLDGDPLFFLVQYSKDGGLRWQTIASDLTDAQLEVDTSYLPGSNSALVRVLASDGVNTGQAQSNTTFTVGRKDPKIRITGVVNNAIVGVGTVLNLQADYLDPDEETIAENDFVWRSDQVGVLGTGSRLQVAAAQLPAGRHEISLTVPGKQGASVSQHVTILRAPSLEEVQNFCTGDCNQDLAVTVNELLTGVNIALGNLATNQCLLFDANGDGTTTIDEILTAVNNALNGCRKPAG